MNKKTILITSSVAAFLIITFVILWFTVLKPCDHEWMNATCTSPATCSLCGETAGEPLGHSWVKANCIKEKTCNICGLTEGKPLGHKWDEATCTTPKTCDICGETEGEPLGHSWVDATCTTAKTCDICGEIEGEPLGHSWVEATYDTPKTCSVCGETEGEPLERPTYIYVEPSNSDKPDNTTASPKCVICGGSISRSDTNYCSSHDCGVSGCPYPAKQSGGACGSYCEFHGCHYSGCLNTPIGGSDYCATHNN